MSRNRSLLAVAIVTTTLGSQAVSAQEDSGSSRGLEEVLITAQKRDENIQKVPVAVQAISNDTLSQRGVANISDLQRMSPSLTVQNNAGSFTPFIRGIGSTTIGSGLFPSVATYVDGVYGGSLRGGAVDFDDAESVQILSGPQGALYGRNATGGAIVVTTTTPMAGDPFTGKLKARLGNYNAREVSASASSGIGESPFAVYVAASSRERDGFIKNMNPAGTGAQGDDLDDRDAWSMRMAISYEPTDRFTAVLRAQHFESQDRQGFGFQAVGLEPNPAFGGLNGTQAFYAGFLQQLGFPAAAAGAAAANLRFSNQHGKTFDSERNGQTNGIIGGDALDGSQATVDSNASSLKLAYTFDAFELSSLTAMSRMASTGAAEIVNADPTSVPAGFLTGGVGFSGKFFDESFQQEFQLTSEDSPIDWVAGITYYEGKGDQLLSNDAMGFSFLGADNEWSIDSTAAFAQATIPIVGDFSGTVGARYTRETYELDDKFNPSNPFAQPGLTNQGNQSEDSSKATYTARLQYDGGDYLVYGGIATGFKGASLSPTNPASPAVDPEEITSYEFGAKWDVTRQLRVNAAAFIYDYDNIHINVVDAASGGATVLVNGTSADITGGELQILYQPIDFLTLRANALILDSEYTDDVPSSGTQASLPIGGNQLAGAPEHVVGVGADFIVPGVTVGEVKFTVDVTNNSGYYLESENLVGTGGGDDDGFTTVDASLNYASPDGKWTASLWGANITDEEYFLSGVAAGGVLRTALAAPPATYGVALQVNFQ